MKFRAVAGTVARGRHTVAVDIFVCHPPFFNTAWSGQLRMHIREYEEFKKRADFEHVDLTDPRGRNYRRARRKKALMGEL